MGKNALQVKRDTQRRIRETPLSAEEREKLRRHTKYRGSAHHKRNPGDFGLVPPSAPRPDKTLCDEARVFEVATADALFARAVERGLVSEQTVAAGFPKHLCVVDEHGRVFEAMYGGSEPGDYHGYPIRRSDALFDRIVALWESS